MPKDHIIAIWVTAALALTTAVLTLMPVAPGPPVMIPNQDKLYHFVAFAALAFPISVARPQWIWKTGVILLAFGALIEVLQPHVGRGCEVADLVADGAGIAAGALLGVAGHRLLQRWRA